jgi:hypothetical protein
LEAYKALREYEDCACGSNKCDDLVEWIISLFLKASAFTIKCFPRPYYLMRDEERKRHNEMEGRITEEGEKGDICCSTDCFSSLRWCFHRP